MPRASAKRPYGKYFESRDAYCVIFVFVVGALVNVACASIYSVLPASAPSFAQVGQPAPEINLPQLKVGAPGENLKLSSLRGKPVIVNFWATWCAPCRAEFPLFQSKYEKYRESLGLGILAVDMQDDEGAQAAQKFADQMNVTFPILLDVDASAESGYQVRGLPTTVFIDRNGIVQDIVLGGPISEEALEQKIAALRER